MMAAMHGRVILGAMVGPLMAGAILIVLAPSMAKAQFYDLDGTYRCLTSPDSTCKISENPPPPLPPAEPATPTVDEAIARIRAQQVTAADIAALEKRAAAKEARAVEALAWCKLNGIGVAADPVEAFFLYGEAAQLGIATAMSNQTAVFETRLTLEQRQAVLLRLQTP